MEITIIILVILLILSMVRAKAYKLSLKALADHYRNKGYPMPTDIELKESSRAVFQQMFKVKKK